MKRSEMTFNQVCEKYLDGLYDPRFEYKDQCTGYKQLKLMVENQITPATKEECERWENQPTMEELSQIPETKYMRSLHLILRSFVQNNWDLIKVLKVE